MHLTDEHRALSFMLMAPAWEALYKAKIAERVKEYYRLLLEPSTDLKKQYPDDYLRGAIAALKWAIEWPDMELNAAVVAAQTTPPADEEPMPLFGGHPGKGGEVVNGRAE